MMKKSIKEEGFLIVKFYEACELKRKLTFRELINCVFKKPEVEGKKIPGVNLGINRVGSDPAGKDQESQKRKSGGKQSKKGGQVERDLKIRLSRSVIVKDGRCLEWCKSLGSYSRVLIKSRKK